MTYSGADMGGGRRVSRGPLSKSNLAYPVTATSNNEEGLGLNEHQRPVCYEVKHIRIPNLPRESNDFYEIILSLHVTLFIGLQFLHLYRTVFWLPQSFNAYAMSYFLIDHKIILYVGAILFRRLPYLFLKHFLPDYTHWLLRYLLTIHMISWMIFTSYHFWLEDKSYLQISYLYLPFILFFYVNGLSIKPLWEISELDSPESVPCHICTNEPSHIREEVNLLRKEFNGRLHRVITTSSITAYYATFIPWSFAQNDVHYDLWWVLQHFILCWILIFLFLSSRAFCPDFSDCLHKVACHLGKWGKLRPSHIPSQLWSGDNLFTPGSIVKHVRELYRAEGVLSVASEPGNILHIRFQNLFGGTVFPCILVGLHTSFMLLALLILIFTYEWYQLVSIGSILVTSLYTYIRLGRDYLVLSKIYEAERIIWTHGT